jgi:hypothetical protein
MCNNCFNDSDHACYRIGCSNTLCKSCLKRDDRLYKCYINHVHDLREKWMSDGYGTIDYSDDDFEWSQCYQEDVRNYNGNVWFACDSCIEEDMHEDQIDKIIKEQTIEINKLTNINKEQQIQINKLKVLLMHTKTSKEVLETIYKYLS